MHWGGQQIELPCSFIFFCCVMPLQRPSRAVRPSPYKAEQLQPGLPCPIRRSYRSLHAVTSRQESVVETRSLLGNALEVRTAKPTMASGKRGPLADVNQSARDLESGMRHHWAQKWARYALSLADQSTYLSSIGQNSEALFRLFDDRAPATLKKHFTCWQRWASFCSTAGWNAADPTLPQLLDFLHGLSSGACLDRGKCRISSAAGVLSAMKFVCWKLGLSSFQTILDTPVVVAWKNHRNWDTICNREAVPLPLEIVCRLEDAVTSAGEDSLFICALLLMSWAGLRWSDIQRLDLSSVSFEHACLRGYCWRTKSQRRGMPWGCLVRGCLNKKWGVCLFEHIGQICQDHPKQDFLLAFGAKPMSYCCALAFFRRCLIAYCGISAEASLQFTLTR